MLQVQKDSLLDRSNTMCIAEDKEQKQVAIFSYTNDVKGGNKIKKSLVAQWNSSNIIHA